LSLASSRMNEPALGSKKKVIYIMGLRSLLDYMMQLETQQKICC